MALWRITNRTVGMRGFGTATFLRCPSSKSTIPHLLYRDPERPLPSYSSVTSMRRWIRTFPIFVLICGVSAASLFNYQKVNSPIVTANLYSLRTNRRVREVLGDEIYFASKLSWIWGTINLVQGKIDIKFDVKGTKSTGQCHFAARRVGGKGGTFETTEWSLTPSGGTKLELLDGAANDPMNNTDL